MSENGGWVFVNNEEAYAAVKAVASGHFWTDSLKRQMYANDRYSPIIIQTGRRADYGSFEAFQQAILAAPLRYKDHRLEYQGPNSPMIEFFAMTPDMRKDDGRDYKLPTIDGKTIDLDPDYAYSSPYMQNKAGSDVVTVKYGRSEWQYDFGKNEIRRSK